MDSVESNRGLKKIACFSFPFFVSAALCAHLPSAAFFWVWRQDQDVYLDCNVHLLLLFHYVSRTVCVCASQSTVSVK